MKRASTGLPPDYDCYARRLPAGYAADRTGRYWLITFVGYVINLFAVPAMALAGSWQVAAALAMSPTPTASVNRWTERLLLVGIDLIIALGFEFVDADDGRPTGPARSRTKANEPVRLQPDLVMTLRGARDSRARTLFGSRDREDALKSVARRGPFRERYASRTRSRETPGAQTIHVIALEKFDGV